MSLLLDNLKCNGPCNVTRYIPEDLTKSLIKAIKLSGGANSTILIPRIPNIANDLSFPLPLQPRSVCCSFGILPHNQQSTGTNITESMTLLTISSSSVIGICMWDLDGEMTETSILSMRIKRNLITSSIFFVQTKPTYKLLYTPI